MKIIVAMDSFKGSLSSRAAGMAVRDGLMLADPFCQVDVLEIADGGEGTAESLAKALGADIHTLTVCGPLQTQVTARLPIVPGKQTAIIEMAQAAGLLHTNRKDPLHATTAGVGEMICYAIGQGCRTLIIGLGGSATIDGGLGMLQALGYVFLDDQDRPVPAGLDGCGLVASIRSNNVLPELNECRFILAADVDNPLTGEHGSVAVFGPQKGVLPEQVAEFDSKLQHYADQMNEYFRSDYTAASGAGAAGGLGYALLTATHAELLPGIEILLDALHFDQYCQNADLIITGEGSLDNQSKRGKVPYGIAQAAQKYQIPVIALAGSVTAQPEDMQAAGITAAFAILPKVGTLQEAMDNAYANCAATARQCLQLVMAMRSEPQLAFIRNQTMIPEASLNQVAIQVGQHYEMARDRLASTSFKKRLAQDLKDQGIPTAGDLYDQCASLLANQAVRQTIDQYIEDVRNLIKGLHHNVGCIQRSGWDSRKWQAWQQIEKLVLCGGLIKSKLGPIIVDGVKQQVSDLDLMIAPHSASLSVLGAARRFSLEADNALTFDFGHSLVKRGWMTTADGITAITLTSPLPARFTSWPAKSTLDEAQQMHQFFLDTLQQAYSEHSSLFMDTVSIAVSIANYVNQGQLINRGGYGKLVLLAANYEQYLSEQLGDLLQKQVNLRLYHDTTAACYGLADINNTALISFGTSLGVGFVQPAIQELVNQKKYTITKKSSQ